MKNRDFGDHELHCVHRWVRVTIEGSEANVFEDIVEKKRRVRLRSNLIPVRLLIMQLTEMV